MSRYQTSYNVYLLLTKPHVCVCVCVCVCVATPMKELFILSFQVGPVFEHARPLLIAVKRLLVNSRHVGRADDSVEHSVEASALSPEKETA